MVHKGVRLDRRRFLKVSGFAGLALGALAAAPGGPLRDVIRAVFRRRRHAAADLGAAVLAPMAGETVSAIVPSGRIPLTVEEVTTESHLFSDRGELVGTVFKVEMAGSADESLPQGTYEIESDRVGDFSLFVVPNDIATGTVRRYEAIFSRLA